MYSVVLLAAMTPGFHPHGAAPAGPVVVGCSGYACSGWSCVGSSCCGWSAGCTGCSGCYGSCYGGHKHCFFGGGGLFGHKHSCTGCCGCSGYSYSCSGWSCFGSCTGYACGGCCGGATWGGAYYAPIYTPGAVYGTVTNPNPPVTDPTPVPAPAGKTETKDGGKTGANIKFQLPADAKLYVDGRLTTLAGSERSFVTPPLAAGKFFYDVKAELVVGGEVVVEQKRLIVEAGASLVESFPKLFAAAEGKGDAVAGK